MAKDWGDLGFVADDGGYGTLGFQPDQPPKKTAQLRTGSYGNWAPMAAEPDANYGKQLLGALTRGGLSIGKAVLQFPANTGRLIGGLETMDDEYLTSEQREARSEAIAKIASGKMGQAGMESAKVYTDAIKQHERGVESILRNHPEWEYDPPENFLDLLTSPRKLSLAVAESVPLLAAAGAMTAGGRPDLGMVLMFATEGQQAKDEALEYGATPEQADTAYVVYGSVAALLENLQLQGFLAIGKKAQKEAMKRTAAKVAQQAGKGGKGITKELVKAAATEALEEMSQGTWAEATAYLVYGKEPEGGLIDFIDRRAQEALVAASLAGGSAGAGASIGFARRGRGPSSADFAGRAMKLADAINENRSLSPEQKAVMLDQLGEVVDEVGGLTASAEKVYMKGFAAKLTAIRNNADNMIAGAGNKADQKKRMKADLQQIVEHYESIADEIEANKVGMPELDEIKQLLPDYKAAVEAFVKSPTEEGFGKIKEIGDRIGELGAEYGENISTERAKEIGGVEQAEDTQTPTEQVAATEQAVESPQEQAKAEVDPELTARYEELLARMLQGDTKAESELVDLIRQMNRPETRKSPDTKPDEQKRLHFAQAKAHIMARRLGLSDKQRRAIQEELTGKKSMKGMTAEEAVKVMDHLVRMAKERGVTTSTGEELADYLRRSTTAKEVKAQAERLLPGQEAKGLKGLWKKITDYAHKYSLGHERAERVVSALDGYTEGPLYQSIVKPTVTGENGSRRVAADRVSDFDSALRTEIFVDENGNFDRKALTDFLTHDRAVVVEATDATEAVELNPSEKVGVYLYAQQEEGIKRLKAGVFSKFANPDPVIADIVKSLTPQEKAVADYIVADLEANYERAKNADKLALGRELGKREMYFPFKYKGQSMEDTVDFLQELINRAEGKEIKAFEPGEVKEIQQGVTKTLDLDAIVTYIHHIPRIEQFIHMAPVARQVGDIIKNDQFRQAINERTDGLGADFLEKWFKDSVRGYVPETGNHFEQTINYLRRKGVVYSLAGNVPSIARQFVSFFNTWSVHPVVMAKCFQYTAVAANPTQFEAMKANAFAKSDMMSNRSFDRDYGAIMRGADVRKMLAHKKNFDQTALAGQRMADRLTTVISWTALYDAAMNSPDVQKQFNLDGSEKAAVEFADMWVSRTQPMGNVENLPDYFRGGAYAKVATAFKNMPNQTVLALKHDMYGAKKAGKISNAMAMYRFTTLWLMPALVLGAMRRGRLPESWKEAGFDFASLPLAGFVLYGDLVLGALEGYAGARTGVHESGVVAAAKSVQDAIGGGGGRTAWGIGKAVGAVTGKIPAQAFRTAEGLKDIATGETTDLRRLVWSKWSLKSNKKEEKTKPAAGASGKRKTSSQRSTSSRR